MRLVQDKCPSCGANIKVDADADEATCQYCSASFRVGDATRKKHTLTPEQQALLDRRRPSPGTKGSPWVGVFVIVALAVIGIVVAVSKTGTSTPAPVAQAKPEVVATPAPPRPPSWLSSQPILADVNGDQHADAIGWVRDYAAEGTPQYLAAFDVETGARLWLSDAFSPNDWSLIRVAHVGDRVLVADTGGLLRAVAVKTGKTVWSTPLGERLRRFCRPTDGGRLRLLLEDDRAVDVNLNTGGLTPQGKADRRDRDCVLFATLQAGEHPEVHVASPSTRFGGRLEMEGMDVRFLVTLAGSTDTFAVGGRTPGTRLPAAASLNGPVVGDPTMGVVPATAKWVVSLANLGAGARLREPDVAWFEGGRLITHYTVGDEPNAVEHLVALDGATGQQVYDIVLERIPRGRLRALAGADGRLFLAHAEGLDLHDAKTGAFIRHLSN